MARHSSLHRRGNAECFVNPAEIIIGEVKAVRGPQVVPFLAERVRQPGETAHGHADREVLALHMAGANLRRVRVAHDWDLLRVRDIGRAVPTLAFGIGVGVNLDDLGEVATVAQGGLNCAQIGLEAIGGDLETLRCGRVTKALNEGVRGGLAATAKGEVQNEFRIPLDGDEAISVTDAFIVASSGSLCASFLLTKAQISSH